MEVTNLLHVWRVDHHVVVRLGTLGCIPGSIVMETCSSTRHTNSGDAGGHYGPVEGANTAISTFIPVKSIGLTRYQLRLSYPMNGAIACIPGGSWVVDIRMFISLRALGTFPVYKMQLMIANGTHR